MTAAGGPHDEGAPPVLAGPSMRRGATRRPYLSPRELDALAEVVAVGVQQIAAERRRNGRGPVDLGPALRLLDELRESRAVEASSSRVSGRGPLLLMSVARAGRTCEVPESSLREALAAARAQRFVVETEKAGRVRRLGPFVALDDAAAVAERRRRER